MDSAIVPLEMKARQQIFAKIGFAKKRAGDDKQAADKQCKERGGQDREKLHASKAS